jgi:hypothetical protein
MDVFIKENKDKTITCEKKDCFNPADFFIEGFFYCDKCSRNILQIIKDFKEDHRL